MPVVPTITGPRMNHRYFRPWQLTFAASLLAIAGGYFYWTRQCHPVTPTPRPLATPATTRAAPTTEAAVPNSDYVSVLRARYPDYPTTQPWEMPIDLPQAAHFVLNDPVYLSGSFRPEMWITRSDAPPVESVVQSYAAAANVTAATAPVSPTLSDDSVHVVRDRVVFVHWQSGTSDVPLPCVVCGSAHGAFEIVTAAQGRRPLPTGWNCHWPAAFSWEDRIVAPTDSGVSIFQIGDTIIESHHEFSMSQPGQPAARTSKDAPAGGAEADDPGDASAAIPRVLRAGKGLVAWRPWQNGHSTSFYAAQFIPDSTLQADARSPEAIMGVWSDLTPQSGWPEQILHIVPLVDGTALVLSVAANGAVNVGYCLLSPADVDQAALAKLVDTLSDDDEQVRKKAFDALSQYGPGAWPILERLSKNQPPEAAQRLRRLLRQKTSPSLSGMTLLGNKSLTVLESLRDGGTVFFAQAGVSIPDDDPDAPPRMIAPAWIVIRPGSAFDVLPSSLTSDLVPGQSRLWAHDNQYVVTGDLKPSRWFVGNGFVQLTRKAENQFTQFVGTDRRGRWIFQTPAAIPVTTRPAKPPAGDGRQVQTLIIDPTLPAPTPRLPVWVFSGSDEVGWTQDGWPVAKKGSAYALKETGWQLLGASERLLKEAEKTEVEHPAVARGATQPATAPSTAPTSMPAQSPLLIDREGTRYYGGLTDLRIIRRSGAPVTVALPPEAIGEGRPWLARTADDRLYLFNQPGRVLRLRPTGGTYQLDHTFTHHVPTVAHPTRIWLDPSGRIIMAYDSDLAIFFPSGFVPPELAEKIPALDDDDDQ